MTKSVTPRSWSRVATRDASRFQILPARATVSGGTRTVKISGHLARSDVVDGERDGQGPERSSAAMACPSAGWKPAAPPEIGPGRRSAGPG